MQGENYVAYARFCVRVMECIDFLINCDHDYGGSSRFYSLEEQGCIEHHGDAYREYMKRTPRWIGIPKSEK